MSYGILIFLVLLFALVVYLIVKFATLSTDDFFKLIWMKTAWLWLPIHAFMRLSREYREKRRKKKK